MRRIFRNRFRQNGSQGSRRSRLKPCPTLRCAVMRSTDQNARCTDLSGNALPCSAGTLTDQRSLQAPSVNVADAERQSRAVLQPVSCSTLTGTPAACVAQVAATDPSSSALPSYNSAQGSDNHQQKGCTDLTGKTSVNCPAASESHSKPVIKMPQERNTNLSSFASLFIRGSKGRLDKSGSRPGK